MVEKLNESTVTLETPDGAMDVFQVVPEGAQQAPALLIAQEAFGVNAHIRDVSRRFAREGYVVARRTSITARGGGSRMHTTIRGDGNPFPP